MSQNSGSGDVPPEQSPETTSVFRPFLSEPDSTESAPPEPAASGVDSLPAGAALLVVKRGPNAGSRFLLDRETTSAGRHPDSDIFLDDVTVSRRHAEFVRSGTDFAVRDLGSLNGTFCDGTRIDGEVMLDDGIEVQVGKFRFTFFASRFDLSDER